MTGRLRHNFDMGNRLSDPADKQGRNVAMENAIGVMKRRLKSGRGSTMRNLMAATVCLGLGALAATPGHAQSEPVTRAPAAPTLVPDPGVVALMMGAWNAEIPGDGGRTLTWQLQLNDDGGFTMQLSEPGGVPEIRSGIYEIDSRSVRLIYPGSSDENDPNSTALNLEDARSLETYFYRLLDSNRMAFRPTLCRNDPCQWIANRVK